MTDRKCLMMVTGAFELGGGIAVVNRLAIHAFGDAGWHVDLFALIEQDAQGDSRYIDPKQVTLRSFGGNKVKFVLAVWWTLLKGRYDVILVDTVNLAAGLAPLSWLGLCRYAVWLFGTEVFPPFPDWEGKLGLRAAWRRLAISSFTQELVAKQYPDLTLAVCELTLDPVLHSLAPPDEHTEDRPELTLVAVKGNTHALGQRAILSVGRMWSEQQYKGQDVMIRAMPEILSAAPGAQLVLAGEGDDLPRLLTLARAQTPQVQEAIFMLGFVPNDLLLRLYENCYTFAMPSRGEGFGLVYLEAMRCAKPCVGSWTDAAQTIIQDGHTGLLVNDPTSPEEFASKLNWLLSDPEKAREMGLAGYDRLQKHYLPPHFQERFWKALND